MTSGQPTLTFLHVLSDLQPLQPCCHLLAQQTHWLWTNNTDDESDGDGEDDDDYDDNSVDEQDRYDDEDDDDEEEENYVGNQIKMTKTMVTML